MTAKNSKHKSNKQKRLGIKFYLIQPFYVCNAWIKSMNNEQLTKIKHHSDSIVKLCESPNTALQAIHQIVTLGGGG